MHTTDVLEQTYKGFVILMLLSKSIPRFYDERDLIPSCFVNSPFRQLLTF